jgi:hypothetical protein
MMRHNNRLQRTALRAAAEPGVETVGKPQIDTYLLEQ